MKKGSDVSDTIYRSKFDIETISMFNKSNIKTISISLIREAFTKKMSRTWDIVPTSDDSLHPLESWDTSYSQQLPLDTTSFETYFKINCIFSLMCFN